jgi:hypothetical protein
MGQRQTQILWMRWEEMADKANEVDEADTEAADEDMVEKADNEAEADAKTVYEVDSADEEMTLEMTLEADKVDTVDKEVVDKEVTDEEDETEKEGRGEHGSGGGHGGTQRRSRTKRSGRAERRRGGMGGTRALGDLKVGRLLLLVLFVLLDYEGG